MDTDRSRILAYQSCPRERWLGYHVCGSGLQRKAKALPLQFGAAFHYGGEMLLAGRIEDAIHNAADWLEEQFNAHQIGFEGEVPDDALKAYSYAREEQTALAEALLRAWWAFEGEAFRANFEIVEVEQENRANLTNYDSVEGDNDDDLVLMFRPDALVRDRQSGDFYIVSWKTCATFGKRNVDQARHDMQSISECWGRQEQGDLDRHIEGVLYKWIVKGRRSKDDYLGIYTQDSPLIYGWMRPGPTPEETEWSWKYRWPKEDGSGNSQLGKGFRKVPIWCNYPGGVKAWVAALATNEIAPRHISALEAIFPQSTPVERRADEVDHWKRQVTAQETEVGKNVEIINNCPNLLPERLDELFPQHTANCHSYSGCAFLDVCWGGAAAEPGELYAIREANHPEISGGDE